MIVRLGVGQATIQLWSPDDIREDFPGETVRDDQIGTLFATSDAADGVLLVGTEQETIARLEEAIAVIRRERAILDGTVEPVVLDEEPLSQGQTEALRDYIRADRAAGDADWSGGATYAYAVDQDTDVEGVLIPAGVYIRQVEGGRSNAWRVVSGDVDAYIAGIEARFLAETDAGFERNEACEGRGAEQGEYCAPDCPN